MEKVCKRCGETKPLEQFHTAKANRDGRRGECIACAKEYKRRWYEANRRSAIENVQRWQAENGEHVRAYRKQYNARPERKRAMRDLYYRRTFGISADEVDAMLEAQGGGCAICGARPERLASLHVDHCHETGRVRGLLCLNCNQGIGKLGEDPDRLERAAAYLRGR